MSGFSQHRGWVARLDRDNVDTDVIISIIDLMTTPRKALGERAFASIRYDDTGAERTDFCLSGVGGRQQSILLAGENFGCGSSREPAVHAIQGMGFRAILAKSFGDIFKSNCIRNGLPAINLSSEQHRAVAEWLSKTGGIAQLAINLPEKSLLLGDDMSLDFSMDESDRHRLLGGRDDVAITLEHIADIELFSARRTAACPWVRSVIRPE